MSEEKEVKPEEVEMQSKEVIKDEEKINNEETKGKEESVKTSKDKKPKAEVEAVVNIYTSFNNTIVHVTDMSGRTISKVSGGMVTKHDRLKANPNIAIFIGKRIAEEIKDLGVRSLYVRIRARTGSPALGPGANAVIKTLSREGFKISNILDTTRIPRGGPKKKGGRRGRRP
jgi:small subunit ribosomal protein S11